MSLRMKNSSRKVSPPQPTYMNDNQIAQYLSDLRTNKPARPNGSRPLPTKDASLSSRTTKELPPRAASALSMTRLQGPGHERAPSSDSSSRSSFSALSHRQTYSELPTSSESVDQETSQEPAAYKITRNFSPTPTIGQSVRSPSGTYRERGTRWMEREEARSIRGALEEMDLMDEEKLQAAAQDEATELVRNHQMYGFPKQNPYAPYQNPDLSFSNRFLRHLEKGSHARSQSLGGYGEPSWTTSKGSQRSASDSSNGSHGDSVLNSSIPTNQQPKVAAVPDSTASISVKKNGSVRRKPKVNFALPPEDEPSVSQRQTSGQQTRTVSGDSSKGVFRNPEDHIYEEPEDPNAKNDLRTTDLPAISALRVKPRNSLPRGARPLPDRFNSVPTKKRPSIFDIHKNPPTQSQKPQYMSNTARPDSADKNEPKEATPTKEGLEIRDDDIRAATSMRKKDRSANLPMPSAVSDRPGRPIVSFDPEWKKQKERTENDRSTEPPRDSVARSRPGSFDEPAPTTTTSVPTINVSESPSIPSLNVEPEDSTTPNISVSGPVPTISAMEPVGDQSARPLPDPVNKSQKPEGANSKPNKPSKPSWYSPYVRTGVPTASCNACALPISGRIVTACGSRFHPECFSCHHCSTALECVAFYEEPEAKRAERLANTDPRDEEAKSKRFYCHLDFHELFSPRCKSCKTPIEGEVIVACGAEWHAGHFFCAECGDPFSANTPFVEKDGYAWCVQCHSKRTASRCGGCKKPVLDQVVVTALGGQWHEKCFVCNECGDGFGPEGRFFVKQGPPRVTAKGRQIGGPVEFAVCEACEGRRLKA